MCLVGYRCGGDAVTLGSGRGFTLGSDGVRTLGRDEGSFPISRRRCGVGVCRVWRGDGIYLHPVPGGKIVGSGDFPSRFIRAGPESVDRGFGTCNGVDH